MYLTESNSTSGSKGLTFGSKYLMKWLPLSPLHELSQFSICANCCNNDYWPA